MRGGRAVQQRTPKVLILPPDRIVNRVRTGIAPEVAEIQIRSSAPGSTQFEQRAGGSVSGAVGENLRGGNGQR